MDSPQRETESKNPLKLSLSAGSLKLDLEADRFDEIDERFIEWLHRFADSADQECISQRRFKEMHQNDAFVQNMMSLALVVFFVLMAACPIIWALTRRPQPAQQSSESVEVLSC